MKYCWSHPVCQTDFSRNQLLCLKTLAKFPLPGVTFDDVPGNKIDYVSLMFICEQNCKYMGRKTNVCRFCSLITYISYFAIPKVFFILMEFLFLNLELEYLFEETCAWVRAHFPEHRLVMEPWAKTFWKNVQKEVLKHSFSVKPK